MEVDIEAGPSSQRQMPSQMEPAVDFRRRVVAFLDDLGVSDLASASNSSVPLPPALLSCAFDGQSQETVSEELMSELSELCAIDGLTELILCHFRPLALDLLARWLPPAGLANSLEQQERRLFSIPWLGAVYPELWSFVHAFLFVTPFRQSPLSHLPVDSLHSLPTDRLQSLLIAYSRLLIADPELPDRHKWSPRPLHILRAHHADAGVRYLAVLCLSQQLRWSEAKRKAMEAKWVADIGSPGVDVSLGEEVVKLPEGGCKREKRNVEGWVLLLHEVRRNRKLRSRQAALEEVYRDSSSPDLLSIVPLTHLVTIIGGTLFLRAAPPSAFHPSKVLHHVHTPSSTSALTEMAPLLQLGLPVLLSAPPSSGKTHMLHHLSSRLHPDILPTNRILTIPLADTTIDVKSLIGAYISSPTKPGTFEWMEGALVKAVRAGRWVVFDDIDRASTEMLVTIAAITRSMQPGRAGRRARLVIQGRDDVEAGDGFALFATRSLKTDLASPPSFHGHHLFREVAFDAPTNTDVLAILSDRFTALPLAVLTALVDCWRKVRSIESSSSKGRQVGLRDLEKWCARVESRLPPLASLEALQRAGQSALANPIFQDEVLLEGADTFVAALDSKSTSRARANTIVNLIAEAIGMESERARTLLEGRKPTFEVSPDAKHLYVGRVSADILPKRQSGVHTSRPFALTRPSLTLLERIAASMTTAEPTLLVGETGTGKTTAVQHIAETCRRPLTVINLSTQTESSDLLGGFKPIDASVTARTLHARWQKLFLDTFPPGKSKNTTYLDIVSKALAKGKWSRCVELWSSSAARALAKLKKPDGISEAADGTESPRKKARVVDLRMAKAAVAWQAMQVEIAQFDLHHVKMNSKLVFSFVEGPLVKALRTGEWLLLDEVNLASQETLEAISTILESPAGSLVLTERGDVEPVQRHGDFRLFACMNPATDVGKKDLPPNLRARFTEIYVPPPDDDRDALLAIVGQYLGDAAAGDKAAIYDVAEMYTALKRLAAAKEIVDGSNVPPHFSMRTLARALGFAVQTAPMFGLRRGLWEGCLMAFTMSLDVESVATARLVCDKHLLGPMKNAKAVLNQILTLPVGTDPDDYVRFGAFWLVRGPLPPAEESRYIITPSVEAKLSDLARVILTRRYPVLIQGPTSSGKTSAIEFLARQTGHRFIRINNHEHTDIQEYLGTYVTDPSTGNLVFQEGLLVTAVRQGHWIVLDELNLAPTDVLEALNRLLDDNRELIIPETQEVVKPHPNFVLFATQNPPGLYAGRKILSRAFRNRFLEVHFDDVPRNELETILCQRCQIAPSYAKKIVQVFEELRSLRQASRVFESKSSFATLRDLFRWADRGAVGYQQLAEDGYMLLAERARSEEDKAVIREVIERILKVTIDSDLLYSVTDNASNSILSRLPFDTLPTSALIWTKAMQRLFSLVAAALTRKEPVLLVGETGCGKTSVCEIIARAFDQRMTGVNCHQNMETADLLGSQRPVRNRHERRTRIMAQLGSIATIPAESTDDDLLAICEELMSARQVASADLQACRREIRSLSSLFEWSDGPLVHAMQSGDLLLLDEVSLADDSVLERLNSVLEPGRTLVLAEKGGSDIDDATIIASDGFHVVATMNPGGDFGKKELSPALRNRFTEIWVPPLTHRQDLLQIVELSWKNELLQVCGPPILDYVLWFKTRIGDEALLGLRDILAWVNFADQIFGQGVLNAAEAFHHGGQMSIVDGLESLPQVAGKSLQSVAQLRAECLDHLTAIATSLPGGINLAGDAANVVVTADKVNIGKFSILRGDESSDLTAFRFEAPTTASNAMRVLRACQLPKSILLEGSPGVGKTSLVTALAGLAGYKLQRINLSDQTDLIDLFGSDLPVEGGLPGEFQWRDAAFLAALQKGGWVLLDEMNLASQTVLEGLNAVLDHRGTVFIPELGRSFMRHPDFRIFAAQNPLQQGGGRKGLPKSFLNRFTKVYLQEHTAEDLSVICRGISDFEQDLIERMIAFNERVRDLTMISKIIGRAGAPWEFNLRDLSRWLQLLYNRNGLEACPGPEEFLRLMYLHRFRNERDWRAILDVFTQVFGTQPRMFRPAPFTTVESYQIGHSIISRGTAGSRVDRVRSEHLEVAESVLKAVELGWLVILTGDHACGKRRLVRAIADGAGRELHELDMHPGIDISELLGSFEQQDLGRVVRLVLAHAEKSLREAHEIQPELTIEMDLVSLAADALVKQPDLPKAQAFVNAMVDVFGQLLNGSMPPHIRTALDAILSMEGSTGFTWVDGDLLTALRTGSWFLLGNANLCSASVLDRLNSLCETGGSVVLSEKGSASGSPEVVRPHPDFRLFMTVDPNSGELSLAMRNRGVELYIPAIAPDEEDKFDADFELIAHAELSGFDTLERSQLHSALDPETVRPAEMANLVASQSKSSVELMRAFINADPSLPLGTMNLAASQIVSQLSTRQVQKCGLSTWQHIGNQPLELSSNPQFTTVPASVFKTLFLVLLNLKQTSETSAWLDDPRSAKSILALSANRRGQRKRGPMMGEGLADYVLMARQKILDCLQAGPEELDLESLEEIIVLQSTIEVKGRSSFFDFSAMQLLAQWLMDLLPRFPALRDVVSGLQSLSQAFSLKSGWAQAEIWTLFRSGTPDCLVFHLDTANRALIDRVNDPTLRKSLLEALVAQVDRAGAAAGIAKLLEALPRDAASSRDENERWANKATVADLELAILASHKISLGDSGGTSLFDLLCVEEQLQVSSLAALKLASSLSASSPAMFFTALSTWLQRLWQDADADMKMNGPADLFSPHQLQSVLRFSGQSLIRMCELPQADAALHFTIQSTLLSAGQPFEPRVGSLTVALHTIRCIFSGFQLPAPSTSSASDLIKWIDKLSSLDAPAWLVEQSRGVLRPTLIALTTSNDLDTIGDLWLAVSTFLLRLYVTNVPIDPAVRRTLMGEVIGRKMDLVEAEIAAFTAAEVATKGIADSPRLSRSRERLHQFQHQAENMGHAIDRPSDIARLVAFFDETHGFLGDIFCEQALAQLVVALQTSQVQALEREAATSSAAGAFIFRLEETYRELADLTAPIVLGIQLARFGLSCHARHMVLRSTRIESDPRESIGFPLALAPITPSTDQSIRSRLLAISSGVVALPSLDGGIRSPSTLRLLELFDDLYEAWSEIRTKEQQDVQAAESLYRIRKTDIEVLSDQDQEAKEFNELFPTYDADADAMTEHGGDTLRTDDIPLKFGKEEVAHFSLLLQAVYRIKPTSEAMFTQRQLIEQMVSHIELVGYDESLDRTSLAFQLRQLDAARKRSQDSSVASNFYFSSNEPEIRKAHALLVRVDSRLVQLMEEWPEQMILLHIHERIVRILSLDIFSPIAQVLSALEQLHVHIEDWEPYANRENSLRNFQFEISGLIIQWRRLELASWVRLLDDQAKQYAQQDDEWALRLFGAVIHGAMVTDDLEAHLIELLPMLTDYLHTSTLGHFAVRLNLLSNLRSIATEIGGSSSRYASHMTRTSTMLHNVLSHAKLYAPRIQTAVDSQRKIIDQAIKDFVKLASWKDVNVYALKASAQKSHKQLHRNIRKFRDVLRQPVAPIFADLSSILPQDPPQPSIVPATPPFEGPQPPPSALPQHQRTSPAHLKDLRTTFERFRIVLTRRSASEERSLGGYLDGMAVDVIETAAALQSETPATLTKENAKIVKNLASRKRKAFADLLKSLRASGFSSSVRADAKANQDSIGWLAARPALDPTDLQDWLDTSALSRAEEYHHRAQILMTALKTSFTGHHDDIASEDLRRAIGFVESLFATSLYEHDKLAQRVSVLPRLFTAVRRLQKCAEGTAIVGGGSITTRMREAELFTSKLSRVLTEVIEGVQHVHALQGTQPSTVDLAPSRHALDAVTDTLNRLESVNASVLHSDCELYRLDEYSLSERLTEICDELIDGYRHQLRHSSELRHLLQPTVDFALSWEASPVLQSVSEESQTTWTAVDKAISSALVIVQQLKDLDQTMYANETIAVASAFNAKRIEIDQFRPWDVLGLISELNSRVVSSVSDGYSTDAAECLSRATPFIAGLVRMYAQGVAKYAFDVKSMYKLTYVVGRVMLDIAQKGFCKPSEESPDDGQGDEGGEIEGTGMGVGTGSKNVSSEIQEESQVEGLQGEEGEGEKEEQEGDDADDDAVSMEEDFDGQLEDGKEREEGDDKEEQEEEEDHDEHRGDVNPLDPGAVDEKFWGDKGDDEDKGGQNDEQVDGEANEEGEKEDGPPSKDAGKEDESKGKEEGQEEQGGQEDGEGSEGGEQEEMEEMPNEQEGADMPQGKQDEVNVQEGERLDLPDDLDLGDDMDAAADEGMGMDVDEDDEDGDGEREEGDERMSEGEYPDEEAPAATGATEDDAVEGMDPEVARPEDDTGAQEQGQESSTRGAGGAGEAHEEDDQAESGEKDEEGDDREAGDVTGQGAQREQESATANQPGERDADAEPTDGPRGTKGDAMIGDSGDAPPESRSLAEILQDIRRRRDEILGQREEQSSASRDQALEEAPSQVEYLHQDQEAQSQQALGPAREDDRQDLSNLNILDDDMEGEAAQPGLEEPDEPAETSAEVKESDTILKPEPADRTDAGPKEEKALTQADVQGASTGRPALEGTSDELEDSIQADTVKDDDDPESDIESIALRDLSLVNGDHVSEDAWRHYTSLTLDLSYALCEQLRLILEPTLATRLQGDFRTGKRLNMRKIIPYIASEFTKDKIWLRRTKPSRREYQVLLSLDDSGSMADGHAVDLAFRTLALVSQALNKLEVGQVSIARFGESVDILHPFSDSGFTDADGAKVIKSFAFKQRRTDVAALVERTLTYLAEARQKQSSSSSAPDLWQLEIIISDGECQDHDRLRTLLRRALEERVMIVFIIVDSLHADAHPSASVADLSIGEKGKSSILQMQKADFKMVNGEMQMEITRYLDSFPFEYYVILRDVEALPGVLADTLRQWIARVSQSQE